MKKITVVIMLLLLLSLSILRAEQEKTEVHLWHQMEPSNRKVLQKLIKEFEARNPHIKLVVLHKGTEDIRTGYQAAAAFTGGGPELVYGPMDQVGSFEVMKLEDSEKSIIAPLEDLYSPEFFAKFQTAGKVWYKGHIYQLADRLGNHLALVYNKKLFREAGLERPPETIQELLEFGQKLTKDRDGDGNIDQWGLVWNYTEPFWYIPFFTGYGGNVFDEEQNPTLNTEAAVKAYELIGLMRDEYKIIPQECDYNIADNSFNQGNAAMIINGDWSWTKYIESPQVEFGLTRIPKVEETGLWCSPFVSAKGYSINSSVKGKVLEATKKVLRFLTSEEAQRRFTKEVKSTPSLKSLADDPVVKNDPVLKMSARQIEVGRLMPITPEMRAVWDAMRPALQSYIAGSMSAKEAANFQQKQAKKKIAEMYAGTKKEGEKKDHTTVETIFVIIGIALGLFVTYLFIKKLILALFFRKKDSFEIRNSRFAVIMATPAAIIIFGVVVYPFFYNLIISLSNMNMTNVNSWDIVGLSQYIRVFSEKIFYSVLFKTIVWTVVNVFFHVTIGVFLAVLLNRHLPGKTLFRVLLLLPWAVPAYITALTWRGMFMAETGAINLILTNLGLPALQWLSQPVTAFIAAMITNIWLGFPFMMVIALGALQSISDDIYEAAEMDGASAWQKFRHVTIPHIKPVMVPAITLGTVWTFNKITIIWLVTNGGQPADKSHILVSYVYRAAFNLYRYGYAAAFSMIIFIILVIFSVTVMRKSGATQKVT
ncbi:MAG: extracellular solute-binding protein [Candidatus Cloacimonetes bacterium]|nr:extracellular solute-binding protein [Candidatus Cloacimonadota bacterium]